MKIYRQWKKPCVLNVRGQWRKVYWELKDSICNNNLEKQSIKSKFKILKIN